MISWMGRLTYMVICFYGRVDPRKILCCNPSFSRVSFPLKLTQNWYSVVRKATDGVAATTHVLYIYMEAFHEAAAGFALFCICRSLERCAGFGRHREDQRVVTPGALVKSDTRTLSKALQVGRSRVYLAFPLTYLPLPPPPSPPPPPANPTLTREHQPCVRTLANRTNDGENNDIQSLVTTTDHASLFLWGLAFTCSCDIG